MLGRWRWCSPGCPVGISSCRCGLPKALGSGRICVISWPTPPCGTRSTWCGCATAGRPVGGVSTRISWCIRPATRHRPPRPGALRFLPSARRGGRQRVQPCAGILPGRPARAAADRPDHLHCRTTTHGAQSRTQGRGAAAGAGSVAAQYQLRPVRFLTTAADPCGPPPRGRVVPKRVLNPGGPRHARADGIPLRGYRHDCLSRRYNRVRADHAAESGRASQAQNRPAPSRWRRGSWPPTAT
jgi:hypothetical protein